MFWGLIPAIGGSHGNAARLGMAALGTFMTLFLTAGASEALATYGTLSVKEVNAGGDAGDSFAYETSSALSAGGFTLKDGGTWSKQVVSNDARHSWSKVYTVSEPESESYELDDLTCRSDKAYGGKADADSTISMTERKATVRVSVGENVECTFVHKPKPGKIVVRKNLVPATDPGRFDLKVDGVTKLAGAGDGATTTPVQVTPGTHTVSEAGPALDGYVRSTACTKPGPYGDVEVARGAGGPIDVPVAAGKTVTCTITNVRKAQLIVEKHTAPADDAMPKTAFDFTIDPGAAAFSLTDGATESRLVEPGRAYTVTEAEARAKGYKLTGVRCSTVEADPLRTIVSAPAVAGRSATVTPGPGDVVTCSFTNTRIRRAIDVVKTGPATAYAGDTLSFGFAVTNSGNEPLLAIDVRDDRCPTVVEGAKDGADGVLDPGETWRYSCSMVAPPHAIGDPNPVVNTVTAEGTDADGNKVQDQDTHATRFLHPAIAIRKSGPATATAGTSVGYTLDVTNPGDMPFAEAGVTVTDARCAAAPKLVSTDGDATPGSLDPGDRWTYICSVSTGLDESSVVNVAVVKATDENARVATDESSFTTRLTQPPAETAQATPPADGPAQTPGAPAAAQAAQAVAPAQQVKGVVATSPQVGTARLRGPSACPRTRVVAATVTGRQIRRVTFYVGGRKVRTVSRADARGRWTLSLPTANLRLGLTQVDARVEFVTASQTRTRTLRVGITRCAARVVRPQFTG